jgi:hypothetical protein
MLDHCRRVLSYPVAQFDAAAETMNVTAERIASGEIVQSRGADFVSRERQAER